MYPEVLPLSTFFPTLSSFFSRGTIINCMFTRNKKSDIILTCDPNFEFSSSFKFACQFLYIFFGNEHLRFSGCMNFGTVYDATQICQYVWCINNDYMQANGECKGTSFIEVIVWGDSFVERGLYGAFFIACDQVRACVRACTLACMRAWAKYRKVRTIFFSSSISLPSPMLRLFRPLFLPLASRSPEAKEARVLLRLTFSGMNYLARQVPVSDSQYCDFAIRRNTRWEYALGVDDSGIVALSGCKGY